MAEQTAAQPQERVPIQRPRPTTIEEFFTYEINFSALTSGSTQNGNVTIEASSDFRWIKGTYFADIAAAAQTASSRVIPLVTVLITDSGSGQQLSNIATPIVNLFGTGEIPFILPVSRIFSARSNVQVTVTNFDAAVSYNLRLSLIGAKIYKFGQ